MKNYYIFAIVIFVATLVIWYNKPQSYHDVSQAIAQEVSKGEGTIINIKELTTFEWDTLYIFGPYSTVEHIEKAVGIDFIEAKNHPISSDEGLSMLVFAKKSQVIDHFDHSRALGDFTDLKNKDWYGKYTENEAIFKVVHEGYNIRGKWLKMKAIN